MEFQQNSEIAVDTGLLYVFNCIEMKCKKVRDYLNQDGLHIKCVQRISSLKFCSKYSELNIKCTFFKDSKMSAEILIEKFKLFIV